MHVNSAGNTVAKISSTFSNSTTTGLYIDTTGDSSEARLLFSKSGTTRGLIKYVHNATANSEAISFGTAGGSERMRIAGSGNVGIGTTSPDNNLHIHTDAGDEGILIKSTGNTSNAIISDANRSSAGAAINNLQGKWNGTAVADILFLTGADTTNKDDGVIAFRTSSADNIAERMRITSEGVVQFDNGISEEYTAVTSSSNATTVNLQDGTNFSHTLTENTTFTFSNPAASGKVSTFTLKLVQDASASGYTVTWPTSVDWPSATAPTLTATASAVDYFVFITHDGGTTYYGFTAGQALG